MQKYFNKELSNVDILHIGKKILGLSNLKWLSKDQLEEKRLPVGNYIINLGTVLSGGTHWVGLKVYKENKEAISFCSYGGYPLNFLEKTIPTLYYNNDQIQGIKDLNCGLWALIFLYELKDTSTLKQGLGKIKKFKSSIYKNRNFNPDESKFFLENYLTKLVK
jgi:hypothetical protein